MEWMANTDFRPLPIRVACSIEYAIPMDLGNPVALGYTLIPLENDGQSAGYEAQSRIEPIQ